MREYTLILGADPETSGKYLERYDPDYADGLGRAWWTADKMRAKRFADFQEAVEEWRKPSKVRPFREDGKPNRPLSAHTITFEKFSLMEAES